MSIKPPLGSLPPLPAEYDSRPLTTRLWLQSRLKPPTRKRLAKAKAKDDTWSPFIQSLKLRTLTLAQCVNALHIVCIAAPRLWRFLNRPEPENAVVRALGASYFGLLGAMGLLPAVKLWATSQLLNLVDSSLGAGAGAPWRPATVAGAIVVATTLVDQWVEARFRYTETLLLLHLKHLNECELFSIRLARPVRPSTDPTSEAMFAEASMHCGEFAVVLDGKTRDAGYSRVSNKMRYLSSLVRIAVSILCQLAVTYRALRGPDGKVFTNLLVFLLFTAPLVYDIVYSSSSAETRRQETRPEAFVEAKRYEGIVGHYREQSLLLRLGDYLQNAWKTLKLKGIHEQQQEMTPSIKLNPAIMVFHTLVWVLLATGTIKTTSSIATLAVMQNAIMSLAGQVRSAVASGRYLVHCAIFMGAYLAISDEQELVENRTDLVSYEARRDETRCMAIDIKNVSICYPRQTHAAVKGVTLSIAPGETLEIVGFNGSGKTTLVKAILGLMDPVEGCVEINGTPVPKYDWSTLAYRMSVMFQDFARFNVTLRQEIGLGSVENIDNDAALLKAVEAGGATPVVSRVPLTALLSPFDTEWKQKYRDIVPDTEEDSDDTDDTDDDDEKKANGGKDSKAKSDNRKPAEQKETKETNLSGGEWQRVALARAFMGADRADLVVFDEPTSALDPRAEAKLFDTLLSLSSKPTGGRKCTTIFISHQFGNVRRADKIAFMEKGSVVEYGTHDELMRLNGKYAELFGLQAKGFISETEK